MESEKLQTLLSIQPNDERRRNILRKNNIPETEWEKYLVGEGENNEASKKIVRKGKSSDASSVIKPDAVLSAPLSDLKSIRLPAFVLQMIRVSQITDVDKDSSELKLDFTKKSLSNSRFVSMLVIEHFRKNNKALYDKFSSYISDYLK